MTHRLPSMQPGCAQGFRSVYYGMSYFQQHGALKPSYQSNPGDIWGFQWDGAGLGGNPDHMHTERFVKFVTVNGTKTAITCGGNSGPSNVDGFHGQGGVHVHAWSCPDGVGNTYAIGAGDMGKLVGQSQADAQAVLKALLASDGYLDGAGYDGPNKYSSYLGYGPAAWCGDCQTAAQTMGVGGSSPTPAPSPAPNNPVQRLLMLTSPYTRGSDVAWVQTRLNSIEHAGLGVDGVYGQQTEGAVVRFQQRNGLSADGVVGSQTSSRLASNNARLEQDEEAALAFRPLEPAVRFPRLERVTLEAADLADLRDLAGL